jgi:hypothetical protein
MLIVLTKNVMGLSQTIEKWENQHLLQIALNNIHVTRMSILHWDI